MPKENLPYSTQVIVQLAHPTPTGELWDHLDYFQAKLKEQNIRSQASVINRRFIEMVLNEEDKPDKIRLNIYSEAPLDVPGRAMTGFSRSLCPKSEDLKKEDSYDPFFQQNTFHGKLFSFQTVLDHEKNNEVTLSNEDMLHALIRLCFEQQSTLSVTQRKALKQIKTILINAGIASIDVPKEEEN